MCAGGPPKPTQPIRPHSRSTVPRVGAPAGAVGSVRSASDLGIGRLRGAPVVVGG
jgi:hypothetical protein